MRVPKIIVAAVISVVIGLQAWTLHEVVTLKVEVATIKAQLKIEKVARQ